MNVEDIFGAIFLFAFASMCFGLAGFIWLAVWDCFEKTEIGSAITKKITECIERNRHDSKE